MKRYQCILCNKNVKPKDRKTLNGNASKPLRKYLRKVFMIDSILEQSVICGKCRLRCVRQGHLMNPGTSRASACSATTPLSPPAIEIKVKSSGKSHAACVICNKRGTKQAVLSKQAIMSYYIESGILLKSNARTCKSHIDSLGHVSKVALKGRISDSTLFSKTGVAHILDTIRTEADKSSKLRLDFDTPGRLSDDDYLNLTGMGVKDFNDMCSHVQSKDVHHTKLRSIRSCVALLKVKLRLALSNTVLGTLFNMNKFQVRRAIVSARNALLKSFVSENLGFGHVKRDDVITHHTRPLAKELFAAGLDVGILVLDGTYLYVEKSGNFEFSRRSFSVHKHRPLIKPMMVVTTTGYIVSVLGPYLADSRNNDASILKHMIRTNTEEIKDWVQEGDVMVVDRGFRDAGSVLEDLGICMEMPAFLGRNEKQLSTESANKSRLVTKIRWVVESAKGRVKRWKFLANVIPNTQIPYAGDYLRIVCAICNKYRPPLSTGDEEIDRLSACKMLHLSKQSNSLLGRIEAEGLDKRSGWKAIDGERVAEDFPKYNEEELRSLTLGVYQLSLAPAYTQEHVGNGDPHYNIFINDESDDVLIAKIQSRHISAKQHKCWIQYSDGAVRGWYCKCKPGSRVVGMCAHITSVVWYLSFQRFQAIPVSGVRNWATQLMDAAEQ